MATLFSGLDGVESNHDWVDLGLPSGTKWATCNVGASAPEEYGDYFAWGETIPKGTYDWNTYKWCKIKRRSLSLTKYDTSSSDGRVDNKTILDLEDDAAHANWGGQWRMPTDDEWDELCNNCEWKYTTRRGVDGYEVKSKTNGNSIFLPAAGRNDYGLDDAGCLGYYWSSSLYTDDPSGAWGVHADVGCAYDYGRYCGLSVRPVFK